VKSYQAVIIGGGPAGLGAAIALKKQGIQDILVVEREHHLGGILRQCIHDGFGLTRFGESLSGPEYAQRFIEEAQRLQIECRTDCTVLHLTEEKIVTLCSRAGLEVVAARAVVLAMGCRERTRGALAIAGTRPAGVMTAGVAQHYMNLRNIMVGREVVVLGSGDIGLIMARRMTLEGAKVKGVFEIQPYPSGLPRNIMQCLNDYDIPLYLSHTVTEIRGRERLSAVTISQVDEAMRVLPGTERELSCDTLILSVGLIPENELSLDAGVVLDYRTKGALVDEHYQTSVPGIFAAGNVLHVHDLVDFVTLEAEALANAVTEYVKRNTMPDCKFTVVPGEGIGHVVPQRCSGRDAFTLSLRVTRPRRDCIVTVHQGGREILRQTVKNALPAEMLQYSIPAERLNAEGDLEVALL